MLVLRGLGKLHAPIWALGTVQTVPHLGFSASSRNWGECTMEFKYTTTRHLGLWLRIGRLGTSREYEGGGGGMLVFALSLDWSRF